MDENSNHYGGSVNYLDYVLLHQLSEISPHRIVDFGAGRGKNGKYIRSLFKKDCEIHAVEGYEPTVQMLKLSGIYDEVHQSLIQEWVKKHKECYDLAVFGDVLEHLTPSEIHNTIKSAILSFDYIIIVVPLYDLLQGEIYGNHLEVHKSFITEKFFDRYHPLEKHIRVGKTKQASDGYTIMNVLITRKRAKSSFFEVFKIKVIRFLLPILVPVGLGRTFMSFIFFIKRILNMS